MKELKLVELPTHKTMEERKIHLKKCVEIANKMLKASTETKSSYDSMERE